MKRRALVLLLLLAACRTTPVVPDDLQDGPVAGKGVFHTVERGQTLWRIAKAYRITVQDLAEVNDVLDPSQIKAGSALWIPGAERVLKVDPAPSLVAKYDPSLPIPPIPEEEPEEAAPKIVKRARFVWPVKGVLFSRFGVRGGTQHDGIDISAPLGTPVVAADAGEVIYAGTQRGYGNIVLVKHADGLITIYAHNTENRVKPGERVKKNQTIATVGQTGRASGPHVHFEVREERVPRNPLFFLPEAP